MGEPEPFTLVMWADIPEDGIEAFAQYESRVLPILKRHGGRLERRLRSVDSRVEVHVISFDRRAGFDAYMADPDRIAQRELLAGVDLARRVVEVRDVEDR